MISSDYEVVLYRNGRNGRVPVREYVLALPPQDAAKVRWYIEYLQRNSGVLGESYARHIEGSIRELRVDFAPHRHRIFYFAVRGKRIVLLHGFLKKSPKTPPGEISRAKSHLNDYLINETYEEASSLGKF